MTETSQTTDIPDLIFDTAASFASTEFAYAFLTAGSVLLLIGALFIAHDIYMRITGTKTPAILYALSATGNFDQGGESYADIIEYTDVHGMIILANTNTTSNYIGNRIPGKKLNVYATEKSPDTVHPASLTQLTIGVIMLAISAIPFTIALTAIEPTIWTALFFTPSLIGFLPKLFSEKQTKTKEPIDTPAETREQIQKRMDLKRSSKNLIFRDDVLLRLYTLDEKSKSSPYIALAINAVIAAVILFDAWHNNNAVIDLSHTLALCIPAFFTLLTLRSFIKRAARKKAYLQLNLTSNTTS